MSDLTSLAQFLKPEGVQILDIQITLDYVFNIQKSTVRVKLCDVEKLKINIQVVPKKQETWKTTGRLFINIRKLKRFFNKNKDVKNSS